MLKILSCIALLLIFLNLMSQVPAQTQPQTAKDYFVQGLRLIKEQKIKEALEAYRKALEINPSYPGAYLGLADYFAKRGQIEEAIKAYDKVLELKPDSPNIVKLYADLLRDNGKRREALAMYKRSLEMLPTNAPALFNAGILSAKFNDLAAAKTYLETLKTVDPHSANTLARFLKTLR